ncbi:MAG TPA: ADP-ribosylglycohydrolase family protein [Gemmatimonadales bacterium]|nr:ADP-ribosylglycohydrolase family protein [Gemmatimonadales bacterium]
MARPIPMAERARGLLVGLARGHAGAAGAEDRLTGEAALAAILAEELLEAEVDLRRLAERWIAWSRRDGRRLSPRTVEALEHLGRYDSPLGAGPGMDDAGPLVRMLPIAIVTAAQPRNLVSGTWHTVMLTHPDPALAWTAVAVNVAAAQLLRGHRDFLPDVIEALQANDAAGKVLSAVRRIPFVTFGELDGGGVAALAATEAALWIARQEFRVERAFAGPAAGPSDQAALIGALLGAREGEQGLPPGTTPESERLRSLAKRLATPRPAP